MLRIKTKSIKKVIAALLSFYMILSLIPIPNSVITAHAGGLADYNGLGTSGAISITSYEGLKKALSEFSTNPLTLSIDADITVTEAIKIPEWKQLHLTGTKSLKVGNSTGGDAAITLEKFATLSLEGSVVIDGEDTYSKNLIQVGDAANLQMKDNAVVKRMNSTDVGENRGAIALLGSGANFTMNGGQVRENKPRGVVLANQYANFNLKGGAICENKHGNLNQNGIGVLIVRGTMTMTGGEIKDHKIELNGAPSSGINGGGIAVGTKLTGTNINNSPAKFVMTGGKISGNEANYGGGVMVATLAFLSGGEITDNKIPKAPGYGGGLSTEYGSKVFLSNVLVDQNDSQGDGSGIWICPTGETTVKINEGMALFDNDQNGKTEFRKEEGKRNIYVSEKILGEGTVEWRYSDGTTVPQSEYQSTNSTDKLSMNPYVSEGDKTKARDKANLRIHNNYSDNTGGGIGTNGFLLIGRLGQVRVTKEWDGPGSHPSEITVRLLENGTVKESAVLNGLNNWQYTFKNLEVDVDGNLVHEYKVEEDVPSGYTPTYSAEYKPEAGNNQLIAFDITNKGEWKPAEKSLKVNKTVEGQGADTNKEFEFTITFEPGNKEIPYAITPNGANGTIKDGSGKFTLKHGQTATFTGIPEGTKYTVVETEDNDYTTNPANRTHSGKIESENDAEANFINTKKATPSIGTSATDKKDGDSVINADKEVTIVDTVSYENLTVGKEYTLKGVLMDKSTGEPLVVNGKEIRNERTFTPEEPNGSVELEFTFDASALQGKTIVVFEKLFQDNKEVAVHEELEDEDQTVTVHPTRVEILKISEDGTPLKGAKLELYDADGNLVDAWTSDGEPHKLEKVLEAGAEYTLKEIAAPNGYMLAADVKFTTKTNGETLIVKMVDTKLPPERPSDDKPVPDTGDTNNILFWGVLMVSAVITIAIVQLGMKKGKKRNGHN